MNKNEIPRVTVICKNCGYRAVLVGCSIEEKDRILGWWRCINKCDPKYYEVFEGELESNLENQKENGGDIE
jgi:C4-type Zn-finger protein